MKLYVLLEKQHVHVRDFLIFLLFECQFYWIFRWIDKRLQEYERP